MIRKKSLLINKYIKIIHDLNILSGINIFPDDFGYSINILIYLYYNFIKNNDNV